MKPRTRRAILLVTVMAMLAVPAVAGAVTGFTGPPFGLGADEDGNVLVADAGAGIHTVENNQITATTMLPGATAVDSAGDGVLWVTTGSGAGPTDPTMDTGQAVYRIVDGTPEVVANLFEFEEATNPDGEMPFDSNPFDVLALSADEALVVDAGANALLHVTAMGDITVMAVFPTDLMVSSANVKSLVGCPDSGHELCGLPDMMPAQSVPTSVAMGPEGDFYVGDLVGFPAPTGESSIWRVDADAMGAVCGVDLDCATVFDGGFTSISEVAFHGDGTLYVAELDEQSWFAVELGIPSVGGTINACDLVALECDEVRTGIPQLTSIALVGDGELWAVRNALLPTAEVFRVHLAAEQMGLVDTTQGTWTVPATNGAMPFFYGNPGDVPMMGDWDCDGVDTPGLYRQADGFVYLRNSNTQGIADIRFFFGNPGDVPIAGDFDGDGCDTVSLYRPDSSEVLVINELGEDEGGLGAAETSYFFGNPGDNPFVGDFDGDGMDTIGLHRPSTGFVYYRNSHTTGVADNAFFWGNPDDIVFAGDWDGDGTDTPALFRPSNSTFYWRNSNTAGNADGTAPVTSAGVPHPVAGHFD